MAPTYSERKSLYARQWASMKIEVSAPVTKAAQKLLASKARYQAVAAKVGVPWFWVACIHWRESSGDFRGILHNGQRIIGTGKKTTIVPKGRGPFSSWEQAAIDAMTTSPHDMRKVDIDCVERFAYEAEKWNGWGYAMYHPANPSPYLWSYTSVYKGGKYVADGKWNAGVRDAQIGVMALLKRMMELDPSISFDAPTQSLPPDIPAEHDPGIDTPPEVVPPSADKGVGLLLGIIILTFITAAVVLVGRLLH